MNEFDLPNHPVTIWVFIGVCVVCVLLPICIGLGVHLYSKDSPEIKERIIRLEEVTQRLEEEISIIILKNEGEIKNEGQY